MMPTRLEITLKVLVQGGINLCTESILLFQGVLEEKSIKAFLGLFFFLIQLAPHFHTNLKKFFIKYI